MDQSWHYHCNHYQHCQYHYEGLHPCNGPVLAPGTFCLLWLPCPGEINVETVGSKMVFTKCMCGNFDESPHSLSNSFLSNELAQPVTIVQNLHIKRTTAYVFDHQKYLDSVIIVTSDIQRTTYSKIGGNTDFIFYIWQLSNIYFVSSLYMKGRHLRM